MTRRLSSFFKVCEWLMGRILNPLTREIKCLFILQTPFDQRQ